MALIKFFLNVFTKFSKFSDKKYNFTKGLLYSNQLSLVSEASTAPQHQEGAGNGED